MNYNNFKTVAKLSIAYGVLLIIIIVLMIFSAVEPYHKNVYLGIAGVFFVVYLLLLIIKPHFFSIQMVKDVLEIRFYNPHPFVSNFRQIKIPVSEYDGYEIKKTLFGPRIIFKIQRGKNKGHYPALSLTAVGKQDLQEIMNFLDELKAKGKADKNN